MKATLKPAPSTSMPGFAELKKTKCGRPAASEPNSGSCRSGQFVIPSFRKLHTEHKRQSFQGVGSPPPGPGSAIPWLWWRMGRPGA